MSSLDVLYTTSCLDFFLSLWLGFDSSEELKVSWLNS